MLLFLVAVAIATATAAPGAFSADSAAAASSPSSSSLRGGLEEKAHAPSVALCDTVKQYTGYYKLTTGSPLATKNYFYWFFEARNSPETAPVVLWLTGGPGCSSEVALFGENGPCTINEDGSATKSNPYSWNTNANLLYVDQPTGTGFSYGTGLDATEVGVARDMYDFLQQFMTGHPQYSKAPFFAFGESYAGHYIPAVTHAIWLNNQNLPKGAVHINLKGTSVGNGLTDPAIQYAAYPAMAKSTNHHAPLKPAVVDIMQAAVKPCVAAIKACQNNSAACVLATDICNEGMLLPYEATGLNPYDMRIKCAVPPLCYDFSNVAKYLARQDIRAQLGVGNHSWSDCNRAVALPFELGGDWMHSYMNQIPDQLNAGIRVLLYAGDQDFICNWIGNDAWIKAMPWPHQAAYNAATLRNVTLAETGEPYGTLRSSNGLSFLQVFEAGHMVPRDQPAAALAMLNAFIKGDI